VGLDPGELFIRRNVANLARQGLHPPLGGALRSLQRIRIPGIPTDVILEAAAKYVHVYEQLTGQCVEPSDVMVPPLERVRGNLERHFEKAA